ncbi:MAG: TonB-dependent receptor [Flavobacteriaceae bacterium]|nr:TonB-dependent receptor [Flavobacteriaceae bacterium]
MKKSILITVCLAVFSITIGFAQVTTAKVQGIVFDDTKVPLFGANIIATHVPSGTVSGAMSSDSGRFLIPNLRVGGPYTIKVSFIGFKEIVYNNVYLSLGKAFSISATMNSDSQALEAVVITVGKNETFNKNRTGSETDIDARQLASLPSISRSAADFYRLEPSSSGGSFGGRNDQYNNFSLDGSIFNNPFGLDAATPGGQTGSQPVSLDAIEQIQVSTAPYDVTLSGFTGASVNAVTKSGTNEFKGTVYGYFRNQDLTGSKIKGEDIFVSDLRQSQYGVSVGGPIIKNKLFFFANFEKDKRSDLGQSWVANTGSGAINESRVLEQDLMDVRSALAALGYDTGDYKAFNHESGSTKGIFKLDWNINDDHRLAFVYNFLDAFQEKSAHPTAINRRGPDFNTIQFQNSGYRMNNKINSFLLEINSTFDNNMTNKLQVGYTLFDDTRDPFSAPAPVINIYKDGSPYIIAGHEPFSINNTLEQRVLQITNNMNYYLGDHTFTFGASFEKFSFVNSFNLAWYDTFSYPYRGTFTIPGFGGPYPSVQDFLDLALPGGVVDTNIKNAQAVFNNSNAAGVGNVGGYRSYEINVGQAALYAQDEWNVSENFKLIYGVRVDKPIFFDTSDLAQEYIDIQLASNNNYYNPTATYYNPYTAQSVKIDNTQMPTDKLLWSPRVGFNYDVTGDSSFQIRGGTGIFTGRLPFVWIGNQTIGADSAFTQALDPNFQFPQVWRSSLGADYKFDNGIIATGDLSYTKDINGVHVQNWSLIKPTSNLAGIDNRPIYGAGDKEAQNVYVMTNTDKGSSFNATVKLQKRFENGLFTSLAYNYMNAKDVNSIEAEITGDAFAFNPALNNVNEDVLANSKYGDKHRIIGVASKRWSYGNDKYATTISTFFEYAQGGRFSYTYGGDINGDGSGVNDLLYVPTAAEIAGMNFANAAQGVAYNAFIQQDNYLNSRRGAYAERYGALSPWRGKWDVKIMQDFKIKVAADKSNTIQLSLDILNIGNLISSDWGLVQTPNSVQPIGVTVDDAGVPTYNFNGDVTETFGYESNLLSRWQMQFGLRYIF